MSHVTCHILWFPRGGRCNLRGKLRSVCKLEWDSVQHFEVVYTGNKHKPISQSKPKQKHMGLLRRHNNSDTLVDNTTEAICNGTHNTDNAQLLT